MIAGDHLVSHCGLIHAGVRCGRSSLTLDAGWSSSVRLIGWVAVLVAGFTDPKANVKDVRGLCLGTERTKP